MNKITPLLSCLVLFSSVIYAQTYTHADTLRGSNGPGRAWWNATKYNLEVAFNLPDSSIQGNNTISYVASGVDNPGYFQIDLQEPMQIDSVVWRAGNPDRSTIRKPGRKLEFTREGNAWFIYLHKGKEDVVDLQMQSRSRLAARKDDSVNSITVYFQGKPKVAVNPPWEGGIIFKKDKAGNPWVSIACQGLGASVWYPCKDYQGDEPDSASMRFTAPADLVTVSNGRLREKKINNDGTVTWTWAVESPINNYNIIPYIGQYVHFGEIYKGERGDLTMDYWVLDSNLVKAREQFRDAPRMMKAFEYWFGPYPFYKDGYKLVDAPHLGMEHQSAVAYGNGYQNGYNGRDLSGSGQGLKFDFIIIHESGHEWFGNNITAKDVADMWVHEAFTNYSEALFLEYYYGKKAASEYVIGLRKTIQNKLPVQGVFGVQKEGSGDMYNKGGNMIHTIRQVMNNDDTFRNILRGMNRDFYHQTVTGKQIENYISEKSGIDFTKVFDQYLRTTQIPVFEYKQEGGKWFFKWSNCISGFNMPVKVILDNDEFVFLYPTEIFKSVEKPSGIFRVDENFYVNSKKVVL